MNNVINKFLLAGDTFMPEIHLKQPQFVYSACGPLTRHKERIKKFKQTGVFWLMVLLEQPQLMQILD